MDIPVKIKICGLKSVNDIEIVNNCKVDFAGFVFAPSKRQITPLKARELIKNLDKRIKAVGVFLNEMLDTVKEIGSYCQLDIIQLHGDESMDYCREIKLPVWKTINMMDGKRPEDKIANFKGVSGYLLDSTVNGNRGGTGHTFDWNRAKGLSDNNYIILAGGLNNKNVGLAIDLVKPHVVDVSSFVESNGQKDPIKIIEFVRMVRKNGFKK